MYYKIGPRNIKKALYISGIDICFGQLFYYNLRTVQQLGYLFDGGSLYEAQ